MESVNIVLAANILNHRKKCGLSQEELAKKLGVTFQAVSKWENAKAAPDITFLLIMADIFGCYIDELFSREVKTEIHYDLCAELPWHDDDTIRGVVFLGKKMLQKTDNLIDKFTFEIVGDAKSVQVGCNLMVEGNVSGGANCNGEMTVGGNFSGGGNVSKNLTVGGNYSGGTNCTDLTVARNFSGDINAKNITVVGNIDAKTISGDVVCNELKCEKVEGNVIIEEKSKCINLK